MQVKMKFEISSRSISLAVPEWLTEIQACKIINAVAQTDAFVQTLEHAPAAAFTALGYEFCHVDSDWLPCQPPVRIMALEFTKAALTASQMSTPLPHWMQGEVVHAINEKLGVEQIEELMPSEEGAPEKAMVAWINDFSQKNEAH